MTEPASRTAARRFGVAAILLGAMLFGAGSCGSVTAKKTDGGAGGSHADSSTKMDVAADLEAHDALENHDASSAKDMRTTGGSGGAGGGSGGAGGGGRAGGGGAGGGSSGTGGGSGGAGAGSGGTGGGSGGTGGGSGGVGGGGTGGGTGGGGAGGAAECTTNADCTLYAGAGSGCCGVCQAAKDPAPAPIECLLACLTPLKTCGCVSGQCVGSKTQL